MNREVSEERSRPGVLRQFHLVVWTVVTAVHRRGPELRVKVDGWNVVIHVDDEDDHRGVLRQRVMATVFGHYVQCCEFFCDN